MYGLERELPEHEGGRRGVWDGQRMLKRLVGEVKQAATRPVMVKLSPNVTSIGYMAWTAEQAGADAVSLVNTFLAMAIDVENASRGLRT